ncbi:MULTISPECIES: A/G-specific adenine glycosylase [Corynebacterium]|uniref:A/G-specific adenine glycosylase n=1 Tax=Corynebacterium TaxID=1716 RepID=UPI001CE432A9|nr:MULTISPECIES: A/G-specific adenine glycosylase [Corynebacterium]
MTTAEAPEHRDLAADLNSWFGTHARPLPWRMPSTTPWAVLVSEVMSQQTPVARVAPLWEAWMDRWPTPADLARAERADVLRMWANLGYPRRALRLRECAVGVVNNFDAQLPTHVSDLLTLPGVGAYTARAVAAFALEQAVPVVDTNVRRVYKRLVRGEFLQGSAKARDLADVAALLPYLDEDPAVRKQAPELYEERSDPAYKEAALTMCVALMELGALVCTATNPACDQCPVREHCRWVALGKPEPSEEEQAAATQRVQKFAGTDRQVRGKVMALLRSAGPEGVDREAINDVWPKKVQLWRAVDSLVADGLAIEENNSFSLPR